MTNKFYLLLSCLASLLFRSYALAITVEIPGDNITSRDVNVPRSTIEGDPDGIIRLIQQINDYLWFSMGAVGIMVALYAGYQIIMAQGDKAKMKKGNELLVGALVGIFIAVFSYVLVRLVVNLF